MEIYTLEQAEEEIAELRGQLQLLGEILRLQSGPTPNTPPSGEVDLFSVNGQPAYINPQGVTMDLEGTALSTFPGQVVTQSTAQTVATFTIPANDAVAGAEYEMEISCHGTWGSTQQALTIGSTLGGTSSGVAPVLGAGLLATGNTFRMLLRFRAICVTTGVSGTWRIEHEGEISGSGSLTGAPGANTASIGFFDSGGASTLAKDTTVAEAFAGTLKWASTTGAPTITIDRLRLRRVV